MLGKHGQGGGGGCELTGSQTEPDRRVRKGGQDTDRKGLCGPKSRDKGRWRTHTGMGEEGRALPGSQLESGRADKTEGRPLAGSDIKPDRAKKEYRAVDRKQGGARLNSKKKKTTRQGYRQYGRGAGGQSLRAGQDKQMGPGGAAREVLALVVTQNETGSANKKMGKNTGW